MEVRLLLAATNPVDLGTLDGTNGFRLDGIDRFDRSGYSVSSAGDVNGDGFDDLIIGAQGADPGGESYIVFGRSDGFGSAVELSTLDGTSGFRLDGIDAYDFSGVSVSSAGDVNGDGFDDLIIGAIFGDPGGVFSAGESYVVFGKSDGFGSAVDLSTLDGTTGFRLDGIDAFDTSGSSVSNAGDVNGDGFDDLIIGAQGADPAGESYVVFGKAGGFASALDLNSLNGTNGFRLDGIDDGDNSGGSVSNAGDVNGDGFDDLIIGAIGADPSGNILSGESYVVFGKAGGFASALNLNTLDGTTGFRLNGINSGVFFSGDSVSSAGDVNGDGFDDLIIRAASGGNSGAGESYVVFGKVSGFASALNLSTLDGSTGFRLSGIDASGFISGESVSGAGDVNGDGFDDLIIGADGYELIVSIPENPSPLRIQPAGKSYVVFGKSGSFSSVLNLNSLNGTTGFRLDGVDESDSSGRSVSGAGDVNGDGFDDLIIGATGADPGGNSSAGESYVVFGRNFTGALETNVVLTANQGAGSIDILVGGLGDDTLISDGGADVLRGGAGNDTLAIPDADFSGKRRLVGGSGTDTLRLDGFGHSLDLTTIADNRIVDIEVIDITGSGNNSLTLDFQEVVNISSTSNTLRIDLDNSDSVDIGSGWTDNSFKSINGTFYNVFKQGVATLQIRGKVDVIDLASLDGDNGFRVDGIASADFSGRSVSNAGDVNGDGFYDLIIGASNTSVFRYDDGAGESYVVFGTSGGFDSAVDLSTLDGTTGFRLGGIDPSALPGSSVSSAGDVNGDGFDDLIIGADYADPGGNFSVGESYVVFGKSGGFRSAIDLSMLDGTNGFRLDGIDAGDFSGNSVSSAGDVNGDGFADLIIGAFGADAGGDSASGESYVVFGRSGGFGSAVDLSTLDGTTGFRLDGIDASDFSGNSVSSAGDVNGDGFADVIIGAVGADPSATGRNSREGESYVVFGKSSSFGSAVDLSLLDGTNGFRLDGIDLDDTSGGSVSSAGDVNGDGFDDLIIGANGADPRGVFAAGESYVVFGMSGGFGPVFDLSMLDGTNGFRLAGTDVFDLSGTSVSSAGDVNGDGFDDVIIGAVLADSGDVSSAGETYVVFGKSGGFGSAIDLSTLNGVAGFRLDGIDASDTSGGSVSTAGDVNGDGFDDLIIGADQADPEGKSDAGESYVVFGGNFTGGAETQVGDATTNTLAATQGAGAIDILIGGLSDDTLISDGGSDVLRGGAGNDTLLIPDADFSGTRRLVGGSGNDTLRLDGSGHSLDLTTVADNRIIDIEVIDITGSGSNSLTLDFQEVVNLSSTANTLLVRRDPDDIVSIGDGWTRVSRQTNDSITYDILTQGAAVLGLQDITSKTPETVSLPAGGGTYEITVSASGLTLEIQRTLPTVSTVFSLPLDVLGDLRINGSASPDQITLSDLTGYAGSITFNASGGNDLFDASETSVSTRVLGGSGSDTFLGGSGNDTFVGGGGNDIASGGSGDDSLIGNGGKDSLAGGGDNDFVNGNAGADLLTGNNGDDTVLGGAGTDTLDGGAGDDLVTGQGGQSDIVAGGGGEDTLRGGNNDIILRGSVSADSTTPSGLVGSTLNVVLPPNDGPFIVLVDAGQLQVTSASGTIADVPLADVSVISITGSNRDDDVTLAASLSAFSGSISFTAGDGDDSLNSSAGAVNTRFSGGAGNDTLIGGSGSDLFDGGIGNDSASGGAGNDTLIGGVGNDSFSGDAGNDFLNGNAGDDSLFGGSGDDTLLGGRNTDILDGGDGNDLVNGQGGNGDIVAGGGGGTDSLRGDSSDSLLDGPSGRTPGDMVVDDDDLPAVTFSVTLPDTGGEFGISVESGQITVRDSGRGTVLASETFAGITGIVINGGAGDDAVVFNTSSFIICTTCLIGDPVDVLFDDTATIRTLAAAGTDFSIEFRPPFDVGIIRLPIFDSLSRFAGSVTFNGGGGNDSLDSSRILSNVLFNGGEGDDTFIGGFGNDTGIGAAGNDSISTGAGNDVVRAGTGHDFVDAGAGDDSIVGGDGNDSLNGGTGNDFLNGNGGSDTILGGDDDDTLLGGSAGDSLNGGLGDDTIRGQGGDDTTIGGGDSDSIVS